MIPKGVCEESNGGSVSMPIPEGVSQAMWEEEIRLEETAIRNGVERFRRRQDKAIDQGRGHVVEAAKCFIGHAITLVSKAIDAAIEEAESGRPGLRHTAIPYLKGLDTEVVAFLSLKAIWNLMLISIKSDFNLNQKTKTIQSHLVAIGRAVEDELRYHAFRDQNVGAFNRTQSYLAQNTKNKSQVRTVMHYAAKFHKIQFVEWDQDLRYRVGQFLLDIIIRETGLVEVHTKRLSPKNTVTTLRFTQETLEYIAQRHTAMEVAAPQYLPTIIPPKPWTSPFDGGYHSPAIRPIKLVKGVRRVYLEHLQYHNMPEVYQAVNTLQKTPWRINRNVHDVFRNLWEAGEGCQVLPRRDHLPLPPKPHDIDSNKESRQDWKRQAT